MRALYMRLETLGHSSPHTGLPSLHPKENAHCHFLSQHEIAFTSDKTLPPLKTKTLIDAQNPARKLSKTGLLISFSYLWHQDNLGQSQNVWGHLLVLTINLVIFLYSLYMAVNPIFFLSIQASLQLGLDLPVKPCFLYFINFCSS